MNLADIKDLMKKENEGIDLFDKVIEDDISLVSLWGVNNCNPNGSPEDGKPRTTTGSDGKSYGVISQVSINYRIRTAMAQIFNDLCVFTREAQVSSSAEDVILSNKKVQALVKALKGNSEQIGKKKGKPGEQKEDSTEDFIIPETSMGKKKAIIDELCKIYKDLHFFGITGIISETTMKNIGCDCKKGTTFSASGPVKFCDAESINPIQIEQMYISKSYNGIADGKEKSSDTMGGCQWKVKGNVYCANLFISAGTAKTYQLTYGDLFILIAAISETYRHDFSASRNAGVFYMGQIVAATSPSMLEKIDPNSVYGRIRSEVRRQFAPYGTDPVSFSAALDFTEMDNIKKANLLVMPKRGETIFYKPNRY